MRYKMYKYPITSLILTGISAVIALIFILLPFYTIFTVSLTSLLVDIILMFVFLRMSIKNWVRYLKIKSYMQKEQCVKAVVVRKDRVKDALSVSERYRVVCRYVDTNGEESLFLSDSYSVCPFEVNDEVLVFVDTNKDKTLYYVYPFAEGDNRIGFLDKN